MSRSKAEKRKIKRQKALSEIKKATSPLQAQRLAEKHGFTDMAKQFKVHAVETRRWKEQQRKRAALWKQTSTISDPRQPPPKGRWLYRMYDAADNLLYIGITDRGHTREQEHRRSKPWYPDVHHISYTRYSTRTELECYEREAIRSERPKYNIQHNL